MPRHTNWPLPSGGADAGEGRGASEQADLFAMPELDAPPPPAGGYRGPTACQIVGITYRQLDYWARTGLVAPTLRGATGSGSHRL
jgi:hypothetical protein